MDEGTSEDLVFAVIFQMGDPTRRGRSHLSWTADRVATDGQTDRPVDAFDGASGGGQGRGAGGLIGSPIDVSDDDFSSQKKRKKKNPMAGDGG